MTDPTTPSDVTIGELARSMSRMTEQMQRLADGMEQMREEHRRTYDAMGERFVPREVFAGEVKRVDERQDRYQDQTDVMLRAAEEELRALRKLDEQREAERQAREVKRADQRRQDVRIVAAAFLSLAAGLIIAIVTAALAA